MHDDRIELPPGDWEKFESSNLAPRKRSWTIPLITSLVTAAAAASVAWVVLNHSSEDNSVSPMELRQSTSRMLAEQHPFDATVDATSTKSTGSTIQSNTHKPSAASLKPENSFFETDSEINSGKDPAPDTPVPSADSVILRPKVEKSATRIENDFNDYETSGQKTRRRFAFAPHLGGMRSEATVKFPSLSFANSKLASFYPEMLYGFPLDIFGSLPGFADDVVMTANHSLPFTVGLDIGLSISPRLSLVSGAEVSFYNSRFKGILTDQTASQTACYLGLPLRLDWTVWRDGRFSAWLGAGGKVDRLVYGRFGDDKLQDNTFNWSAVANAGLRYDFLDNIGLYLAPELSWYFKPEDPAILTYRTDNPLMFSVNFGLAIGF